MTVTAVTHINLRGDARQALGFYHAVFGGRLTIVSYKEAGQLQVAAQADHVMWGQVAADSGFRVMAYDVPSSTPWNPGENAFFISVEANTPDEISACWEKLSDGGAIVQPLLPSQWSPLYGMLKDRFGVTWTLSVISPYQGS